MDGERASATPRPARAISSSRPGALPPLTPIPPTVAPPIRIGQPPAAMINTSIFSIAPIVPHSGHTRNVGVMLYFLHETDPFLAPRHLTIFLVHQLMCQFPF